MKKQTILILTLLGLGTLFSVGYAASTIITDTSISTTNLTVTGTCTGCGGSEGNFNSYSTLYNKTVTPSQIADINYILPGNDGSSIYITRGFDYVTLNSTSNMIADDSSSGGGFIDPAQLQIGSSSNGEYKIYLSQTDNSIHVIKNNSLIQTIGITTSQCSGSNFSTMSVGISGNGKYIIAICEDSGFSSDRVSIPRNIE